MKIKLGDEWFSVDISTDERKLKSLTCIHDLMDLRTFTEFQSKSNNPWITNKEIEKYIIGVKYDNQVVLPEDSDSLSNLILIDPYTGDIVKFTELPDDFFVPRYDLLCSESAHYHVFHDTQLLNFDMRESSIEEYRKYRDSISDLIKFRVTCRNAEGKITEFFNELSKELLESGIDIYFKSPTLSMFDELTYDKVGISEVTDSITYYSTDKKYVYNK